MSPSAKNPPAGRDAARSRVPAALRGPRTLLSWGVVFLIVVTAALAFRLVISSMVAEGAYELHELQQQQLQLERQETQLRAEVESASSPQQLAAQAGSIGMVPGEQFAMLDPATGQVTGSAQPGDLQQAGVDASLIGTVPASGPSGVAPPPAAPADVPSATDIDSPETR